MNSKEQQKISQVAKDLQSLGKEIKKDYENKKNQVKMDLHLKDMKTRSTNSDIFKYSFTQALARIALLPFDVLKTKHQAIPSFYSNLAKGFSTMRQNGQLWLGLSPSFLKYFMFSFLSGEEVREGLLPTQAFVILSPLVISSLLFPLESVKLRMQLSQPGAQFPRSFLKASQQIHQQQGFMKYYKGYSRFFKGYRLMLARDLIYYSTISTTMNYSFSLVQSLLVVSGAIILSHPFDTLLTNIYYRKTDSHPNVVLRELYKELGVKGLYRGVLQRFMFLGGGMFATIAGMYFLVQLQTK